MINEKQLLISEYESLCFVQNKMPKIQKWLLQRFPSEASSYIYPTSGVLATPAGEALIVSKCIEYKIYDIKLDRRHNKTCYEHFPVILNDKSVRFLHIHDRRLVTKSYKIKMSKPPKTHLS